MDTTTKLNRRQVLSAAIATGVAISAPRARGAAMEGVTVTETVLHGRQAFTLANGSMSISTLTGGGFIGDVHLVSRNAKARISPLYVPEYQTIDPFTYDVRRDGAAYGTGVQRELMSGYMGHFTCFPQFGHSDDEFAATGYGQHGEAILVKWERVASAPNTLEMTAHLPLNQYDFRRSVSMLPGEMVAYVTETAENLTAYDRPVQWVQHVTMGPPFAEVGKLWVDASADQVISGRGGSVRQTPWPAGVDAQGRKVDCRAFSGTSHAWLMQRSGPRNWVSAYNENYDLLFGHIYDATINPWVLDWQSNEHQEAFPVPGKVVARGLCWGDSPVAGGVKGAVNRGRIAGVPLFSWMGPRARRSQSYIVFMAELPGKWQGVARITVGSGKIRIAERGTGRVLSLKAERA